MKEVILARGDKVFQYASPATYLKLLSQYIGKPLGEFNKHIFGDTDLSLIMYEIKIKENNIIAVLHDQDCAEYMRVQELMIADFLSKYPNYCRCCHAYGYHGQHDHEGEWEEKECSKCLGKDLCPRCMTPTMVEREDNDMWDTCSTCGWLGGDNDYGNEYCHPNPVKCVCATRDH